MMVLAVIICVIVLNLCINDEILKYGNKIFWKLREKSMFPLNKMKNAIKNYTYFKDYFRIRENKIPISLKQYIYYKLFNRNKKYIGLYILDQLFREM